MGILRWKLTNNFMWKNLVEVCEFSRIVWMGLNAAFLGRFCSKGGKCLVVWLVVWLPMSSRFMYRLIKPTKGFTYLKILDGVVSTLCNLNDFFFVTKNS